jgi:hypothetical protein
MKSDKHCIATNITSQIMSECSSRVTRENLTRGWKIHFPDGKGGENHEMTEGLSLFVPFPVSPEILLERTAISGIPIEELVTLESMRSQIAINGEFRR